MSSIHTSTAPEELIPGWLRGDAVIDVQVGNTTEFLRGCDRQDAVFTIQEAVDRHGSLVEALLALQAQGENLH